VGIVPDFVNVLEVQDVSQQLKGVSFVPETNLILLPQTHQNIFNTPTKRKMLTYTAKDPLTTWLSRALNEPLFGYHHHGTVSVTALLHLMKMGCNPIFLLGQDLAYPQGQMYSTHSVYRDRGFTIDENGPRDMRWANKEDFYGVMLDNDDDFEKKTKLFWHKLTTVKGWQGETLYTDFSFDSFRLVFEQIQDQNPDVRIVNCSEGGAYIHQLDHLPFAQAVEKYQVRQHEAAGKVETFLSENYQENDPASQTFERVYSQYQDDRAELSKIAELSQKGNEELTLLLDLLSSDTFEEDPVAVSRVQQGLKTLAEIDEALLPLTQCNELINCYAKKELFIFSRTYYQRMQDDDVSEENYVDSLKDNLHGTKLLYGALNKGANTLLKTMDPIFETFPQHTTAPATSPA
jgi:hypothetical protein